LFQTIPTHIWPHNQVAITCKYLSNHTDLNTVSQYTHILCPQPHYKPSNIDGLRYVPWLLICFWVLCSFIQPNFSATTRYCNLNKKKYSVYCCPAIYMSIVHPAQRLQRKKTSSWSSHFEKVYCLPVMLSVVL
jgi:hypothetical protein